MVKTGSPMTVTLDKSDVGEALATTKAIGGDIVQCVEKETGRRERKSLFKYRENNKCLMSSSTRKEVQSCSK